MLILLSNLKDKYMYMYYKNINYKNINIYYIYISKDVCM